MNHPLALVVDNSVEEEVTDRIAVGRKTGLYLKDVGEKGRGLFCEYPIAKDEELETAPAIILSEELNKLVEGSMLHNYVFSLGEISEETCEKAGIENPEDASAVVMGIASYCNHDEVPNAEVVWEEYDGDLYYILRAMQDIPAHTEICTSYGDDWFESR